MVLLRCGRKPSTLSFFFRTFSTSALPIFQNPEKDLFLCNSTIMQLARLGRVDDARKVFEEMPQRDSVTWNSMVTGYSQNRRVDDARALFDAFQGKNVRTWTAVLTGYARNGRIGEARRLFDEMPERNVISWNAMISGYVQNGDVDSARRLFDEMPERNVASWNSIITGYCHCHRMVEGRTLFNQMPVRDLVSWTVMISGYVRIGEYAEAWRLFWNMRRVGVVPDQSNFAATLSAVTNLNELGLIVNLHTLAIKTGFDRDVVVGTAILNGYTRNAELGLAIQFFEAMPERNEYSWTTIITAFSQSGRLDDAVMLYERVPEQTVASRTAMMTAYAQHGRIHEARLLFEQIPHPNTVTWNAMLSGYAQNGMIEEADEIFRRMPIRNDISLAAMISGCAQNGRSEEALELLSELHRSGSVPSHSCFTSALSACANIGALEIGRQIHALAAKTGSQFNSYVGNGLITMYARCKNVEDVSQVFSTMRTKDIVSWNSLIAGLSQNHMLDDARTTFEKMPDRDVVSWTAMISAYVQAGHGVEAMEVFAGMLCSGTKPNTSTVTSILSACASLGATKLGKQIHCLIFKLGLEADIFVGNALISMYFKCGCADAIWVFNEMPERDVVTWNSVLDGCAHHGFGKEAVEIFEQMKAEGVLPNQVSFVGLLCACSHAGLIDEGWHYFNSMSRDYGLMPLEAHYACMVDLLGRAGHLYEAEALIENMPIEPDSVVWGALLGACKIHQNIELGRRVAEKLFALEPQNSGTYILLSNIYASLGLWNEVGEVRKVMKDRGVTKEPGFSWIQIKNKVHCFVTGDKNHEQTEEIFLTLKELYGRLKAVGYVPDTNFVLHDVEEEQKENALLYHSEKLAIAYGLLNTPSGTPIQIMKNLRICGDCHTFAKYVSGVTEREIDIRDGKRFHHFRCGSCSCGDYW
ncbi:pentatricopeptide repeat-containing protein At4g02750-like [Magnolia sinica]|uniref:pentatricopeptide repeat-containing protein At4g02750-like n=1 Tax=Magnolia sinica TaxID=86752 RepID=UPI0026585DE0|nr:pentatricopeptide repeat-containing protein At4g02750-like [Magnolia sinica]